MSTRYTDSYFTAAVSFAETIGKDEIEIDYESTYFVELANEKTLLGKVDQFAINKDELYKTMLRNIFELNKDSAVVLEMYIPEMIRLKMYEKFQTYVFSQLSLDDFQEFYKKHKLDIEFMTAYPYRNKENATILMCMHLKNMWNKLIESGKIPLGHVDSEGYTALMIAISIDMPDVALKLLETGKSNPGHVNNYQDTALLLAISKNMPHLALKILETGESNPGCASRYGATALMLAISTDMPDVALKILETGNANVEHVDKKGVNAFMLAFAKNMQDVVTKIAQASSIDSLVYGIKTAL